MHKRQQKTTAQETTTPDITWFTPSVGAASTELCFIQLLYKITVLICALSCRSLQSLKPLTQLQASTHIVVDLLNHFKPSSHTTAEVIHAHNWDLTFPYQKITLALHQFLLHQKPNLTSLQECLFI